ncbi:MAG: UDP-N-acetylglucosamine 1-carboxyvinyltransferase [Rickettsiaceae bacterium]
MDSILIKGGTPLIGEIKISGSKNAALPIMAASLLTQDNLQLSNIPKLSDISTMKALLENHGVDIIHADQLANAYVLNLNAEDVTSYTAPYDLVRKMRASIWVLGPLLARFGQAKVSLPGGCAIGARQVDMHIQVMQALGASVKIEGGYICASSHGRLNGCTFIFSRQSVGATINGILAAVLASGESSFFNCAIEPEIVDLCNCLVQMGAKIEGIGTSTITIVGQKYLEGTHYSIMPDRIEAGTYMLAAAATRGAIKLKGINYQLVQTTADCMVQAGSQIDCYSDHIHIKHEGSIRPVNISTKPYPGFATDLQAQFMSLMTMSEGTSLITENIFENRFMHVPELCRMGANIIVDGHNATINGVTKLIAAEVMASDLRASVSLVIAGLCAEGETRIRRVYHLDRGYQDLEQKLANCGADIRRVPGDTV